MTQPYLSSHLFEINDNLSHQVNSLGPYEYISIDNFYKRPEDIYDMLKVSWAHNWKIKKDGRNFKDYYDCRTSIPLENNGFDRDNKTSDFLKNILSLKNCHCTSVDMNIFQWINIPKSSIQFSPHQDPSFNVLIYLDKINSGGTALYEKMPKVKVLEEIDIRFDTNEENVKYHVIPSTFNRCVIFNGNIPHGGYIENHSKYSNDTWRYNAVYFYNFN